MLPIETRDDGVIAIRTQSRLQVTLGALIGTILCLAFIGRHGVLPIQRVALGVFTAGFVYCFFRSAVMGIFVDDHGLTIRAPIRTHHVPWDRVAGFETCVRVNARRWAYVGTRLTDGRLLLTAGAQAWASSSKADELVAELEKYRRTNLSKQAPNAHPDSGSR
jgi:hypothetical protein